MKFIVLMLIFIVGIASAHSEKCSEAPGFYEIVTVSFQHLPPGAANISFITHLAIEWWPFSNSNSITAVL